jgi:hypothetical protein
MLVFLGDFKYIIYDVCGTCISNFVYWALEMEKQVNTRLSTYPQTNAGTGNVIITSTLVWEAGTAICWAVDRVAKCQK